MRNFFYYTRQERRGIVLLATLCFLLFVAQWVLPLLVKKEPYDFSAFQQKVAEAGIISERDTKASDTKSASQPSLFYFNPNSVSEEELQQLGLPQHTVRAWLSYIRKGGRFRSAADVQAFRKLSDEDRSRILPYLLFHNKNNPVATSPDPVRVASVDLFPFNPNNISQQDLAAFGLSRSTIRAWMNYRSKGGFFKDAAALASFRALPAEEFTRLQPYLHFETEEKTSDIQPQTYESKPTPVIAIDINSASAEEWQQLRGIGPAYSTRIVKFRDALGGFVSINQVADTYSLPDSVFQSIKPQLQLSPIRQKLAINVLDAAALAKHPYLDRKSASILVAYREQHGPYRDLESLQAVRLPDPDVLKKVIPYLDFN